ncbi:MAG: hypothetical protein C7K11_06735 [Candidatus Amulumruptor caecigallinarius]|uniref:Uncharacterized protein n=1 Tax=Candidatus Amulumruptor caecigallinarius TaxID=2109911 RepID=A0A4Q0U827_9BACT|nr:MAG: hypothetical protein C7K11_06735 [Candidatus Amulumruptor caecigallinarius]HJE38270.1 hypothetical protein [Candidatus Amulumruptor caecigallinarius]
MSKPIISTSLDSLMADILPADDVILSDSNTGSETNDTSACNVDCDTDKKASANVAAIHGRQPESFARLYNLTQEERACFTHPQIVQVSLSDDVAFALKSIASHKCPQGLIISAIMREYILTHLDDIKKLLYNTSSA